MAMDLRSRLRQLTTPDAKPLNTVKLADMTYVEHAKVADERLYDLSDIALARIGLEGMWPDIERVLFLDTETTGLSRGAGTIAFMIGLGYVKEGAFVIEQHMVGDYPDEPLMLEKLASMIKDYDVVVSFNGKAFDVPLLEMRAVLNRMKPFFNNHRQLDLMHPSRRLWKRRLPNCKLVTLEEYILSAGRENDLPGSEAPKRFFEYLKTGDIALLDDVLHHNMLDIASLGGLLIALCEAYAAPGALVELPDLYSMGRAMERIGDRETAQLCYERAARPQIALSIKALKNEQYGAEANWALATMKKRAGDTEGAMEIYNQMIRRKQMGANPQIELAKIYEHTIKDLRRANEQATAARALAQDDDTIKAIDHRIARLSKKLKKQGKGDIG